LRLSTEQKGLIDFTSKFSSSLVGSEKCPVPDIYVTFKLNDYPEIDSKCNKISRDMYLGDNSVIFFNISKMGDLHLKLQWRGDKFFIDAFLTEKRKINLFKFVPSRDKKSRDKILKYIYLLYYLVYIPFFYYLERFRSLCLLHAGAIKYKENGIIISGLGGVGKTTFTVSTLLLDDCKILSDNVIFNDTQNIYSQPGVVAIGRDSLNILSGIKNQLIPIVDIPTHHDRMYFQLPEDKWATSATPKYIFWIQQGDKNQIKPVKKDYFTNNLFNLNILTDHIRKYFVFAGAADLISPKYFPTNTYFNNHSSLLSKLDCFILEFKPGNTAKHTFTCRLTINIILHIAIVAVGNLGNIDDSALLDFFIFSSA